MNKKIALSFVLGVAITSVIAWILRPHSELPSLTAAPMVAATTAVHSIAIPPMDTSAGMNAGASTTTHAAPADSIDVLAERLKARLEKEPNDMNGWVLLARSYHYLQRWDEAQAAFAKAKNLGYRGEAEPLPADTVMRGGDAAAPDPIFEDVSRVAQQKSAELQARQQQ